MNQSVLIVEDEVIPAADLDAIVRECGMTPLDPCKSILQVIQVAARTKPDFALIDIRLGKEMGYDICHYLHWNHQTTCVYVTGNPDLAEQHMNGAVGVLLKPYSSQHVMDVLTFMRSVRANESMTRPRFLF